MYMFQSSAAIADLLVKTVFSFNCSICLSVLFGSCDYLLYYPEYSMDLFMALPYSQLL